MSNNERVIMFVTALSETRQSVEVGSGLHRAVAYPSRFAASTSAATNPSFSAAPPPGGKWKRPRL